MSRALPPRAKTTPERLEFVWLGLFVPNVCQYALTTCNLTKSRRSLNRVDVRTQSHSLLLYRFRLAPDNRPVVSMCVTQFGTGSQWLFDKLLCQTLYIMRISWHVNLVRVQSWLRCTASVVDFISSVDESLETLNTPLCPVSCSEYVVLTTLPPDQPCIAQSKQFVDKPVKTEQKSFVCIREIL